MALHPRVYLKLSPLVFPATLSDASGSKLLAAASSAASALGLGASYAERRAELRRRMRTLVALAFEAFGEDRILWATTLQGVGERPSKGSAVQGAAQVAQQQEKGDVDISPSGKDGVEQAENQKIKEKQAQSEAGGDASGAGAEDNDEQLTPAEEWYEICRETFQQIGLGDKSLDKIFNLNAANVYHI